MPSILLRLAPLFLALLPLIARAQEEPEPPLEPNMTGVIVFFVAVVVCVIVFVWYMVRNSKKAPEEREGDKW